MNFKYPLTFLPLLFAYFSNSAAQDFSLYQKKIFIEKKDSLPYRILFPENYQHNKKYPLVIFLHGSEERGRDNEKQLMNGGALFLKEANRKNFPAIIIFPQCPADSTWNFRIVNYDSVSHERLLSFPYQAFPTASESMTKHLCDSLVRIGLVDSKRIYIGGLSLGAQGTYDFLIRYSHYFAAAFTIAGAGNVTMLVEKCSHIPLWIFHGAKDDLVLPEYDRVLYAALREKKAPVKYTEYPEANHNSWDSAFAEPDLLPWLFAQHK